MIAMLIVGVMRVSLADSSPAVEIGGEYFTIANIWYEYPEKILSTNFHKGAMIPVGTKVIIDYYGGTKIKFTGVNDETKYVYIHAMKHSKIKLNELFNRYFSKEDPMTPGGAFSKFTIEEQDNIKNGTLDVGMSKEATLMAYGYPPTHRTPSLKNNVWTYWRARAGRFLVTFRDDKISNIQY